jgi:hypothetical protein
MTREERRDMERDALARAQNPIGPLSNFPDIIIQFAARGIPVAEIRPRENVFTYHAWRALGRQVRRGEHGVKVTTFVPMQRRERDPSTGEEKTTETRRPATAVVFHITQTDPVAEELNT